MKKLLTIFITLILLVACTQNQVSDQNLSDLKESFESLRDNEVANYEHNFTIEDKKSDYATGINTKMKYHKSDTLSDIKVITSVTLSEAYNDEIIEIVMNVYINDNKLYIDSGNEKLYTDLNANYVKDVFEITEASNLSKFFKVADDFQTYFKASDFKIDSIDNEEVYSVKLRSNLAKEIISNKDVVLFKSLGQFDMMDELELQQFYFVLKERNLSRIVAHLIGEEIVEGDRYVYDFRSQFINHLENNEVEFNFPDFSQFEYVEDLEL